MEEVINTLLLHLKTVWGAEVTPGGIKGTGLTRSLFKVWKDPEDERRYTEVSVYTGNGDAFLEHSMHFIGNSHREPAVRLDERSAHPEAFDRMMAQLIEWSEEQ